MDLTGNIKIVERGEPFTIGELRDMADSRAFKRFLHRVDSMIEAERARCESGSDPESWRRAQGALKALRTVKELPVILEREMTNDSAHSSQKLEHPKRRV